MTILIAGLVIFLGAHCLPMFSGLQNGLKTRLGANGYRGAFSLLSAIGLGLIIWGKSVAPFEMIYTPPHWGPVLALWVMPVVFILFAAANMPGKLRRLLRHPMLIGTVLWAGVHLLSNGDLASILLFGGFGLWAGIDLISASLRSQSIGGEKASLSQDVMAIVGGLLAFGLVHYFHATLFGVAVI